MIAVPPDTHELWWSHTTHRDGTTAQPHLVTLMQRRDGTWYAHLGASLFGVGADREDAAANLVARLASFGNVVVSRAVITEPAVTA